MSFFSTRAVLILLLTICGSLMAFDSTDAFEYIKESGADVIKSTEVKKVLKMETGNFRECIIKDSKFKDAIAELGYESVFERNRWNFVKVASPFDAVEGGYEQEETEAA
ncbi:hypothetical protein ACFLZU_03785 [Thermodesulfobacteriota bacterium]